MEAVVPWCQALIELIEPHDPKASKKGGRPPYPLATMLRVHLLQQWSSLSDPAMEEALIEVPTMRRFAGIELISVRIPDETTILTFRHLLEKHKLGEQIFETVKTHLVELLCKWQRVEVLDPRTRPWGNGFTVVADTAEATVKVQTPTGRTAHRRRDELRVAQGSGADVMDDGDDPPWPSRPEQAA
jgi:hypothetical protein